ncbi:hypothetical protein KKC13_02230 [bacterium]|nr:hypothetical protein [bacterium]MBU1959099.1 hypothetical protein [bacterium]
MLQKKILYPLLFLALTAFSYADTSDEATIKKALEGINQIKVMETTAPKVVSEVLITEQTEAPKKVIKTKVIKTKKALKKPIKKSSKKSYKKKVDTTDFSKLKDVETLGVVSKSKPYELGN